MLRKPDVTNRRQASSEAVSLGLTGHDT